MASWLQKIGRALLIARETKDISRRNLAKAAGITRFQLSRYEQGDLMHLETLGRLLQSLDGILTTTPRKGSGFLQAAWPGGVGDRA
jgi:transcriptional regulator with XRE-family HTH domain